MGVNKSSGCSSDAIAVSYAYEAEGNSPLVMENDWAQIQLGTCNSSTICYKNYSETWDTSQP